MSTIEETPPTEETSSSGVNLPRLIMLLTILTLAGLFVPLMLLSSTLNEEAASMELELLEIRATLEVTPRTPPEEATLQAELSSVRQRNTALRAVATAIAGQHVNWPAAMAVIGGYDNNYLSLLTLTENGDGTLTIVGTADDETIVLAYADLLETHPEFTSVFVRSITSLASTNDDNATKALAEDEALRAFEFTINIEINPEMAP